MLLNVSYNEPEIKKRLESEALEDKYFIDRKLYPNVDSPIKCATPDNTDYVVIRENTGGLYTGVGGIENQGTPDEVATQAMVYTRNQVERCIRFAFETALKRNQNQPWKGLSDEEKAAGKIGKVTLCGKTNVLLYVLKLAPTNLPVSESCNFRNLLSLVELIFLNVLPTFDKWDVTFAVSAVVIVALPDTSL